nr:hypothetical protein [Fodinibius sp.]NIV15121.1 hypothetical protein [Fodinibius sp.]NIY28950.1 hypothetical protein [Fodinibius sp.]
AQVNVQDWQDHTPLYFASIKGHTEIVDFLLAHNANTELGNNLNQRPLAVAAKYGHYNTVKTLLMHGAKVNCKNVFDRTPLHEAAMWSGKEVINILISYGADVSAKDDDNDTPLHQAAMLNNIKAAKALVENGADLFAKNDYDYAKLYIAATQDNNEAAKELLRRGTASYRSNKNKTPKEIALKCGFKELAQYLQTKEDEKRLGVGLTSLSIYSKYMDREKTDALNWVLEGDYEIVTSFYDLPKKIQDKILPPLSFSESLRAAYIRNLDLSEEEIEKIIDRDKIIYGRMAEPNQPFNRSDIIVEALPTCRFTIGGFSEDRAFLVYEEGGYVYNQKFIVLKRNRSIDILFFGYCWSFVFSLEQLKSAIDSGRIYVAPNSAYWIF